MSHVWGEGSRRRRVDATASEDDDAIELGATGAKATVRHGAGWPDGFRWDCLGVHVFFHPSRPAPTATGALYLPSSDDPGRVIFFSVHANPNRRRSIAAFLHRGVSSCASLIGCIGLSFTWSLFGGKENPRVPSIRLAKQRLDRVGRGTEAPVAAIFFPRTARKMHEAVGHQDEQHDNSRDHSLDKVGMPGLHINLWGSIAWPHTQKNIVFRNATFWGVHDRKHF